MQLTRLLLIATTAVPLAAAPDVLAQETLSGSPRDLHLFLLAGQSNMAGRGAIEPQDLVPHPRIYVLTRELVWRPAVHPLHWDKPAIVGVGLGRSFANCYAASHPGVRIGLIPAAVGGSSIEKWTPSGIHKPLGVRPYDDALRLARAAQQSGKLRGVLWHQGESDCQEDRSGMYSDRLQALVDRLREDLDKPQLPIVVGQLGQFRDPPWGRHGERIDNALQQLALTDRRVAFVPSAGLRDRGDQLHFNRESYIDFGRRYFAAFRELTGSDRSNKSLDATLTGTVLALRVHSCPPAPRVTRHPTSLVARSHRACLGEKQHRERSRRCRRSSQGRR